MYNCTFGNCRWMPAAWLICAIIIGSLLSASSALIDEGATKQTCSNPDDTVEKQAQPIVEEGVTCGPDPASTKEGLQTLPAMDTVYGDELRQELLDAYNLLSQGQIELAVETFSRLASRHPQSPHCHFGLAMVLQKVAEETNSSTSLEQALKSYEKATTLPNTPEELYLEAMRKVIDCRVTLGKLDKAAHALEQLITRYPESNSEFKTRLDQLLLQMAEEVKVYCAQRLRENPQDVTAQLCYGVALIEMDKNLQEGADLLKKALSTDDRQTRSWQYYHMLGEALLKLGRRDEAAEVHKRGAELGVFLSHWQRSRDAFKDLTARPVWTSEQTGYSASLSAIAKDWHTIRDEALNLLNADGHFKPDNQDLTMDGDWLKLELYRSGKRNDSNCELAPKTCALVERVTPDATGCTAGQIKFSVLRGGTRVVPHCGPVNWRIRAHLGLRVPEGAHIRVGGVETQWMEGEWLLLDDSFEHEVWHEGTEPRIILIVDFWHPDMTPEQRATAPLR